MLHHAHGHFSVDIRPLTPAPAEGLSRLSINKQLSGDLTGSTRGEMFSGGDPTQGMAGYVAIEVFTGTLAEREGTFALQHSGTMDQDGRALSVIVVPGSGTAGFKGIRGTFEIQVVDGRHRYDFSYSLP